MPRTDNPLIVQSNRTLLLDVHAPLSEECRNALIPFAELVSSPEHLHTYQITPLSLWNAAGAGFSGEDAVAVLEKYSRYDIPQSVIMWIKESAGRFGKLRLVPAPSEKNFQTGEDEEFLYLVSESPYVYKEIEANPAAKKMLVPCEYIAPENAPQNVTQNEMRYCFKLLLTDRGTIKQNLLKLGWPVKDDVPLVDGEPLEFSLRKTTLSGKKFEIRRYQSEAAQSIVGDRGPGTGFGTIVLPCGAGKTIVGIAIMDMLRTNTLIVTTNISAVHQWISYPHFSLFRKKGWGLVIYDEVHMLPAPVFRVAAELQAVRRVGLTATLVREDGCEGHVFSLVGPKRYDVPWKELERDKWIASAECVEVRLDLDSSKEIEYAVAGSRIKHRIASENSVKTEVVRELVTKYSEDKILVIGQYIDQLQKLSQELNAPIITGKTPNAERDRIYSEFRNGTIRVLVVSKVANFAIDLPDASIAIQVSGTFGSRQEEAQRLGRILRPKERTSRFFTLITRNTVEEDFGSNRQKFLAEQGYSYRILRYINPQSLEELDEQSLEYGGCM